VQGCAQQVVLLMVREAGRLDLRAVVRMYPGATEWDLSEAIRHLLREGVIARSSPPSSGRSEWAAGRGEFNITATGLRHLGAH
jgi:Xaa-Pro aminopeptidase